MTVMGRDRRKIQPTLRRSPRQARRRIHQFLPRLSGRDRRKFIVVNDGRLDDTVIEERVVYDGRGE